MSYIKDIRSTGRRHARKALYTARVPFKCVDCGKTNTEPPKDAPSFFEQIWPEENRVLVPGKQGLGGLQADHESKDLYNNDANHLSWRCPSCHKLSDQKTEKGVATKTWTSNPYNFHHSVWLSSEEIAKDSAEKG